MGVNNSFPERWKNDIATSVDHYNKWFFEFAPTTFRKTRVEATIRVNDTLRLIDNFRSLSVETLVEHPEILPILRMSTCPPLAQDRLSGLAGVPRNLVNSMEDRDRPRLPPKMSKADLYKNLGKIISVIDKMIDLDIFIWLEDYGSLTDEDVWRAATVVADRLCGADANPIIRNEQERRQLALVRAFLEARGYYYSELPPGSAFDHLRSGEFTFRLNVPGKLEDENNVNIPVVIVIKRKRDGNNSFPLLFEAKSAGDFANVNKRRKEESNKSANLKRAYGDEASLNLLLCGYFDSGYLGYAAAEGCDWIWEHRIEDLELFGL